MKPTIIITFVLILLLSSQSSNCTGNTKIKRGVVAGVHFNLGSTVSHHDTIIKKTGVLIPYKVPVPFEQIIKVPVRHNVLIPVDAPYHVHVPKPYPVHFVKNVPYFVDKPYTVPVSHHIPIPNPVHFDDQFCLGAYEVDGGVWNSPQFWPVAWKSW